MKRAYITGLILFLIFFCTYTSYGQKFICQGSGEYQVCGSYDPNTGNKTYWKSGFVQQPCDNGFMSPRRGGTETGGALTVSGYEAGGWFISGFQGVAGYGVSDYYVCGFYFQFDLTFIAQNGYDTIEDASEHANECATPLTYNQVLRNNLNFPRVVSFELKNTSNGSTDSQLAVITINAFQSYTANFSVAGKGCGAFEIKAIELVDVAPGVQEIADWDNNIQNTWSIGISGAQFPTPNGGFRAGITAIITVPFQSSNGEWGTITKEIPITGTNPPNFNDTFPLYDNNGNRLYYGSPNVKYRDDSTGTLIGIGDGGTSVNIPDADVDSTIVQNPNQVADPNAPALDIDDQADGGVLDPTTPKPPTLDFPDPSPVNDNPPPKVSDNITEKDIQGDIATTNRQIADSFKTDLQDTTGSLTVDDDIGTTNSFNTNSNAIANALDHTVLTPTFEQTTFFVIPWPDKFGGNITVDFSDYSSFANLIRVSMYGLITLGFSFASLATVRRAFGGN